MKYTKKDLEVNSILVCKEFNNCSRFKILNLRYNKDELEVLYLNNKGTIGTWSIEGILNELNNIIRENCETRIYQIENYTNNNYSIF